MRLIHTSDWHLGQTLHGQERDHEHARFLAWLLDQPGVAAPIASPAALAAPVAPQDVAAMIARLRDPKLTIDQRDVLHAQLLALGEEGAKALLRHVEEGLDKASKREAAPSASSRRVAIAMRRPSRES